MTPEQAAALEERVKELLAEGVPEVDAYFVAAIELGIIDVDEPGVNYSAA